MVDTHRITGVSFTGRSLWIARDHGVDQGSGFTQWPCDCLGEQVTNLSRVRFFRWVTTRRIDGASVRAEAVQEQRSRYEELGGSGMATRNERHVVPSPTGGWDVRKPGAQRSSGHSKTQADAIDRAREIVGNSGGGGEVVIHDRQGRVRDSDTVAPGNDPNPPRDKR